METFLALWILIVPVWTTAVIEASNIDAQHVVLYDVSGTSMPDQQFNITFNASFTSVPMLAYGINDIRMNDRFLYENFTTV